MIPDVYKPETPAYTHHTPTASHPEKAEIQTKGPEPVKDSTTRKEGEQAGSDTGDSNGGGEEDCSDDNSCGTEVESPEITSHDVKEISAWVEALPVEKPADPVPLESFTPEPGVPAVTTEEGKQPAVIFKEEHTIEAQPLPTAVGGKASAKPPVHLIFVNVQSSNESDSGELGWGGARMLIKSHGNRFIMLVPGT